MTADGTVTGVFEPSPIRLQIEALGAAADERQAARMRKISRIPKYRRDERHALLDEADALYAADCAEVRALWHHYAQTGRLP